MTELTTVPERLVDDLRHLILEARSNASVAINAELTGLYWRIGERIQVEVLGSGRASYASRLSPRWGDN